MKVATCLSLLLVSGVITDAAQLGPRPFWLVDQMLDSDLKDELMACADSIDKYETSDFSIGHRGAALQFPEHTASSYKAAMRMGAGIVECDVTFTKDLQLVCRHDQCDLHTTTNVVTIPEMNAKCTTPWSVGVTPVCCTSDFTLDELKTLCAKMDSSTVNINGTAEEYAFGGTPDWRTDLYGTVGSPCEPILTHQESIKLIKSGGSHFTPELKAPVVEMPFTAEDGTKYSYDDYRQQIVDEYIEAGIPPKHVWMQSFVPEDIFYWLENTDFGDQAVALDETEHDGEESIDEWIDLLVSKGAKIVAPALWMLVEADESTPTRMAPTYYAKKAKEAGLDIITWSLERTPPGLDGWYWQSLQTLDLVEGDNFNMLYVLAFEVEVLGVFSDWPATTTFFANCFNLGMRSKVDRPALPTPPNLATKNIRVCSPDKPCGMCEGDCKSDSDCEGNLICHKKFGRPKVESEAMVPGCLGYDYSKTDWCVEP